MEQKVKITECSRDAMQGIDAFIPTENKINYINKLLDVGFDVLDFGSFVHPNIIPQLKDTEKVIEAIDTGKSRTELLAIVGNLKGAERAEPYEKIKYLGFPFSVSETFLKRNINANFRIIARRLLEIQELCHKTDKEMVVYISMAFGNPYKDKWSVELVEKWTERLVKWGVRKINLSDTIGCATPKDISQLFSTLIPRFSSVEFGAHFHTTPFNWYDNINAAYTAGCRKFDAAIKGFGGCPMAIDDNLLGNLPTENLLQYLTEQKVQLNINNSAFNTAIQTAVEVFPETKVTT